MHNLKAKHCVPCEGGIPKMTEEEVLEHLTMIEGWMVEPTYTTIAKSWKRKDFADAMQFANAIAKIAEEEDHHPDIFVHGYKNVTVSLSTHAIQGLSENDFILAAKIDAL